MYLYENSKRPEKSSVIDQSCLVIAPRDHACKQALFRRIYIHTYVSSPVRLPRGKERKKRIEFGSAHGMGGEGIRSLGMERLGPGNGALWDIVFVGAGGGVGLMF